MFGSSNNEVLFHRLLHWPGTLIHFHGNPFQSTINLKMRFGNKIHSLFNNYLLNFNHSRLLIIYLQDNGRSELTERTGLSNQTHVKPWSYLVLSFTKCSKNRGHQIIQRTQREVGVSKVVGKSDPPCVEQAALAQRNEGSWCSLHSSESSTYKTSLSSTPRKLYSWHDILQGGRPHSSQVYITI